MTREEVMLIAKEAGDETPEPAAWINFNAATGERNVSFVCESELASIPLWREPPRKPRKPLRHVTYVCPVCAASLERQE